ncbi:MAG: hypothetical protein U9Q27_01520 [Patescibacteria group bacterium]|nr:hypothetical protein [Patescibacteria group bacterium]
MKNLIGALENEINEFSKISETITWHSGNDILNDVGHDIEKSIILHEARLKMFLIDLKKKSSSYGKNCGCHDKTPHSEFANLESYGDLGHVDKKLKLYCVVYTGKLIGETPKNKNKNRIILFPTLAPNDSVAKTKALNDSNFYLWIKHGDFIKNKLLAFVRKNPISENELNKTQYYEE